MTATRVATHDSRLINHQDTPIDNIDTVEGDLMMFMTTVDPIGYPSGLTGNACTVLQFYSNEIYRAQIAFGFGSDKIAIRRKRGSGTWSDWKYTTLGGAANLAAFTLPRLEVAA